MAKLVVVPSFFFAWVFRVRMCAAGILLDEAFCALCTYPWGPVNNTTCRSERVGQDKCAFVYTPYLRRRSLEQGSTINFLRGGLLLGSVCAFKDTLPFFPFPVYVVEKWNGACLGVDSRLLWCDERCISEGRHISALT